MNTTTTTNPGTKQDDQKVAMPFVAATKPDTCSTGKPDACATTATKSEACSATASKAEACATTDGMPEACGDTHDGKVVSISGSKLVMSGCDNREHTHTVAADAQVCCDGTACRTQDLKVGSQIRVTTKKDEKQMAVKIESLDKQAEFAPCCN